uniref:Uncharacterized protein n=1 Tax=Megaselia scalaris TaxID=36166 RepID=T1GGS5_MEGSC
MMKLTFQPIQLNVIKIWKRNYIKAKGFTNVPVYYNGGSYDCVFIVIDEDCVPLL